MRRLIPWSSLRGYESQSQGIGKISSYTCLYNKGEKIGIFLFKEF
jgi:hypothetical protein